MKTLYEQLCEFCATPSLVRTFGYGYLDALVQDYADGKIDNQRFRREHYMLRTAVEARLLELEKEAKAEALKRLMVSQERGIAARRARITDL